MTRAPYRGRCTCMICWQPKSSNQGLTPTMMKKNDVPHPIESVLLAPLEDDVVQRLKHIRLMAFDVDGVLTDGRLWYGDQGEVFKGRSEEHTSELQSRFDLVCRLLLEKKKLTR